MAAPRPLPAPAKALLGALVAVAFLGGLEGLLRLLGVPDPGLYEGDPATLWTLRPDLDRAVSGPAGPFRVQTNALGLRGAPPPAAGPWTLALGCSTTFGWGVEAEAAWPARLAEALGEPVVNGGVPGWSTEQARRGAGRWLDLQPSRVILAYGVRDAWPAARPDRAARPTRPLLRTHLARLLLGLLRPAPPGGTGDPGTAPDGRTWRVPADEFVENTRQLMAMAGDAPVVLLWFPQQADHPAWREGLATLGPVLAPELPPADFFPDDPVHLTARGHADLAAALAAGLSGAAAPRP